MRDRVQSLAVCMPVYNNGGIRSGNYHPPLDAEKKVPI